MKVFIGGKSLTQFHDPGQCELSDPTVVTENSDKKKGNPVKILTWIFQSDFGQILVRFWSETLFSFMPGLTKSYIATTFKLK